MATQSVVHDPKRRSLNAIQQRLEKDQLRQQQQQQQKNEKDKMEASDDVNVSSKEPHKPHSLPTPTKKPVTKDPQDDGFAAYTKLSHPVDDKLLETNVKLSSGKKSIADKVLHKLLRSGDSAHKYSQGKNEKKVEENNYILLDNFVPSHSSSASGSKKASLMNSKRSKCRMSMKRLKRSGALNLPQDLQKFDLYKPMHAMWESYMMKLTKVTGNAQLTSTLPSADLLGAFMFVAECKIESSFTGVQGLMIRETSQTFGIITRDDKLRVVPKKRSVFIIQFNGRKITLHGDKFNSRDNVLQR